MSKETSELLDRVEVTLKNVLATYNNETDRFGIPDEDLAVSLKLAVELLLCAQSSLLTNALGRPLFSESPGFSMSGHNEGPNDSLDGLLKRLRKPS